MLLDFGDFHKQADSEQYLLLQREVYCVQVVIALHQEVTQIDYITISSTGNAFDFGDLASGSLYQGAGCYLIIRGD